MNASIRMASLIALAWATLLLYLAGCGGKEEPGTVEAPTGGPISLEVAGGYPPFNSEIVIDEDGAARTVSKSYEGKRKVNEFTVPADELDAIRSELDDIDLGSLDIPQPGDCCDLVYYELSYGDETVETEIATMPVRLDGVIADIQELKPRPEVNGPTGGADEDLPPPR